MNVTQERLVREAAEMALELRFAYKRIAELEAAAAQDSAQDGGEPADD